MNGSIPWVLVGLAGGLLAVIGAVIIVLRMQRRSGGHMFSAMDMKAFIVQFSVGLACALTGAYFMFDGDILGSNTAGIAQIMGISGIFLIVTAGPISLALKMRKST
jgi:hypothetical protein